MDVRFARYRSTETQARYLNGTWYVVRYDMYPHTTYAGHGMVTRQGHCYWAGARQGFTQDGGFAWRSWERRDTDPR